jgi:hypothetical protein
MGRIISFRGQLASGTQDEIVLHTNNGTTGYKINKFQIFPRNFNVSEEYNMSVWKTSQTTFPTTFNFSDNRLLAAAYIEVVGGAAEGLSPVVVFDNEIFNQDIYIAMISQSGAACNYYIELEQMDLALDESTVATLKDIRNS